AARPLRPRQPAEAGRVVAALAGLVCGFAAVFAVWLPSTGVTARLPEWVPADYKSTLLAWPWFAPLGAGTTVLVALLLNLARPAHAQRPAAAPRDGSPQPGVGPAR